MVLPSLSVRWCGRNFEYISEDPRLTCELVVPIVRGIETSDVAACVKHFAMNNQETERLWVNVEADERTMREIYFPAFQAVVQKAGAKSIMGSYNLIRGTHVCENKDIMGTVLRKELGIYLLSQKYSLSINSPILFYIFF